MFLDILKKDIQRKKTMNVILLLFTILASMFVSSGLSNVVSVLNGTDYFFDLAGVGDYVVITQNKDSGVEEILKNSENVEEYWKEEVCWATCSDMSFNGEPLHLGNTISVFQALNDQYAFFDSNNHRLEKIQPGEVFFTVGVMEETGIHIGDEVEVNYHGVSMRLKVAGSVKDALMGSEMFGNKRFLFSDEDYQKLKSEESRDYTGEIFNIRVHDIGQLKTALSSAHHVLFEGERSMFSLSYVMESIVALIVLILSLCLCIVSFVLMKFAISFTIHEEFREIGVMKAIGIKNRKIRSLYMVKYLACALTGGVIGFIAGIPFGNFLMKSVSKKMVLGNDQGFLLNVCGAVFVVLVTIGFAYFCTRDVKKLTPIDAIRSGSTGERYKKKRKVSLKRSPLPNAVRLAINDILSSPKRYVTVILSFFLFSIFVFGLVEVTDTMKSDSLTYTFGKPSDMYIEASVILDRLPYNDMEVISEKGNVILPEMLTTIEQDLQKMNIPGHASVEMQYKYWVTAGEYSFNVSCEQNAYVDTSLYRFSEGSAPQNAGEIAVTEMVADDLHVQIGDTVEIDFGTEKKECMVVAYFQSLNQLGNVILLHQDAPTDMKYAAAYNDFQVDFDDHPDAKTIEERIKMVQAYYGSDKVKDAAQFCVDCLGVVDIMDAVKYLLLVITLVVLILVTILMEHSFIHEEKSQIAMLKAIGFKDRFIVKWHTYRFLIVTFIAEILAIALTYPITKLWCDPIWSMMGCTEVDYYFNPLSVMVIYPCIILAVSILTACLTVQSTRKIKCTDARNNE